MTGEGASSLRGRGEGEAARRRYSTSSRPRSKNTDTFDLLEDLAAGSSRRRGQANGRLAPRQSASAIPTPSSHSAQRTAQTDTFNTHVLALGRALHREDLPAALQAYEDASVALAPLRGTAGEGRGTAGPRLSEKHVNALFRLAATHQDGLPIVRSFIFGSVIDLPQAQNQAPLSDSLSAAATSSLDFFDRGEGVSTSLDRDSLPDALWSMLSWSSASLPPGSAVEEATARGAQAVVKLCEDLVEAHSHPSSSQLPAVCVDALAAYIAARSLLPGPTLDDFLRSDKVLLAPSVAASAQLRNVVIQLLATTAGSGVLGNTAMQQVAYQARQRLPSKRDFPAERAVSLFNSRHGGAATQRAIKWVVQAWAAQIWYGGNVGAQDAAKAAGLEQRLVSTAGKRVYNQQEGQAAIDTERLLWAAIVNGVEDPEAKWIDDSRFRLGEQSMFRTGTPGELASQVDMSEQASDNDVDADKSASQTKRLPAQITESLTGAFARFFYARKAVDATSAVWQWIAPRGAGPVSYAALMHAYSNAGEVASFENLWREMATRKQAYTPIMHGHRVHAHAVSRRFAEATALADQGRAAVRGHPHAHDFYERVVLSFAACKKPELVARWIESADEDGILLSTRMLNHRLLHFASAPVVSSEMLEELEHTLTAFEDRGVLPDVVSRMSARHG